MAASVASVAIDPTPSSGDAHHARSHARTPKQAVTSVAAAVPAASHGAPLHADDVAWGPAPATFPPGAELAVLHGDPAAAGAVFTLRLRMPNDYVFPPHFHPEDEHVTVIAGTFRVGLGDVVDEQRVIATLQRGGYIIAPKGVNHWARTRGQTIVQVHGIGPFQTTFVGTDGRPLTP